MDSRTQTTVQPTTPSTVSLKRERQSDIQRSIDGYTEPSIVIVDPVSTGAHIALQAVAKGLHIICVWSDSCKGAMTTHVPHCASNLEWHDTFRSEGPEDVARVVEQLRRYSDLRAVIVGAETGVKLADQLSEILKLRTNGTSCSELRRHKYKQQERVRESGLRAPKEALCHAADDVMQFLQHNSPSPFKMVVKPCESAGSDGVKLCDSHQEVLDHFELLCTGQNALGFANAGVLVQEFLMGEEYVIDSVSLDGTHKTVAMWKYDKRCTNGSAFVYFGFDLVDTSSSLARTLIEYNNKVLDALGIQNGPSHGEVMLADGSSDPCLVEMNCRAHGSNGDWIPIVDACVGYSQVSATLDAFLEPAAFERLPAIAVTTRKYGKMAMVVSRQTGVVAGMPGIEKIEQLPSCHNCNVHIKTGDFVQLTVDLFTCPATVNMINTSKDQLEMDYKALHANKDIFQLDQNVATSGGVFLMG